jgi:hypothetical protein
MANQCPNVNKKNGGSAPGNLTTSTTIKTNVSPAASTSKARASYVITPNGDVQSEIVEVDDSDSEQTEN